MNGNAGVFAYLFKHDFRVQTRRWLSRRWYGLYFAAVAVILMVVLAIWGGQNQFKPDYLLYVCFAFPYMFFGVAFARLKREWSNGTAGWWLTLPYPRSKLLLAKLAAAATVSAVLLIVYFGGLLLLELYNQLVHGFDIEAVRRFLLLETEYLLVVAVMSPFMLSFGLFTAIIARTKLRALAPLSWLVFAALGNVFNWLNITGDNGEFQSVLLFDASSPWWIWAVFPASWLLAAAMFAGTVGVCKREMN